MMNVLVHSKTLKVTDAIRAFAHKQSERVRKFAQPVSQVRVFVDSVKSRTGMDQESIVKVELGIPGKNIVTKSRAKDLYLAISQAMKDASRSLRKRKEIRQRKRGKIGWLVS